MSLEGAYRSPQHWEAPPARFGPLLDIPDAFRVEAAWSSLPEFPRHILRAHYCLKWPTPQVCRVVTRMTGIPCRTHGFEKHLADAHEALELALQRNEEDNHNRLRTWVQKVLAFAGGKSYKHTTTEQVRVA